MCGLHGIALIWQVRGPEFKPQYWKKKEELLIQMGTSSLTMAQKSSI